MSQDIQKQQILWQPIIELTIVLVTVLGSTIPLYLHTDGKIDEHRRETTQILNGIQAEMKDFHTRLIKIEEARK